jgi:hypothetical protein
MADLEPVFRTLRELLEPYAATLVVKRDDPGELYLDTHHVMENGQPLFFGAVQARRRYVSYHLMPVYVEPELLAGISPALRKRMQGKSCFNFTSTDAALVEELAALTQAGYERYRERGYV